MNKKLQVFVSSTYTDLQEERQAAVQTILDAGHIPVGMELFNNEVEPQLETIYKCIDKCDIFMLILGGRYGCIEEKTGQSYIELEYKYALSKNIFNFTIVLDDNFLFSKAVSCGKEVIFETNYPYQYNAFKSLVFSNVVRIIRKISNIPLIIYNYLHMYSIKPYENDLRKYAGFYSYLFMTDLIDKSYYYNTIGKKLKISSISDVISSKCILDPLGNPITDINNIRIDVSEVNDWMLNELNENPTELYQLSPRRFEELIAEIFIRKGYDVELTPTTHDGGIDIYAASKNDLGSFLYLVECKKYKPTKKVGVKVIRDLYGVLSKENATYGIIVTTSDFTKPAHEFQEDIEFKMSLKNFNSIQKWLCDVT